MREAKSRLGSTSIGILSMLAAAGGIAAFQGGYFSNDSYDPARQASPSSQSDELQRRANTIFESFNGSMSQREASSLLQAWSLNGAMDVCMEANGYPEWDWSAARNGVPRTNALDASLFFAPPLNNSYSKALQDQVTTLRSHERLMTLEPGKQEAEAARVCANSTRASSDREASEASVPGVVASLRDDWWRMLASWDEDFGDVGSYSECFAEGSPSRPVSSTEGDTWKGDLARLAPRAAEIPEDSSDNKNENQAWQEFLALESGLEAVDWACRSIVYEKHQQEVGDEISRFASEHTSDIEAAQAAWEKLESEAQALPRP